jgi:Fe2+ transport system protein B
MNLYKQHALRLLFMVAGLALLVWAIGVAAPQAIHLLVWWVLLFFAVLTLLTGIFVLWGARKFKKSFTAFFFTAMIIRFFASVIFITVAVVAGIQAVLLFVANFFVLYLCFQVFEITSLVTNLRAHLENPQDESI